jgi:CelD/BcsL family acetyltransferase involved in cellulose biosynthesis
LIAGKPIAPLLRQVTVETITSPEGVAALQADYEHLCGLTGNKLPYALHEWHLTWCHHFLNCSPNTSDEPHFHILRNAERTCVAILPFIISRRRIGPLKVTSIRLLGADPAITEIQAPLVERGYEQLAVRAVRDNLAKIGDWDWIHWAGMNHEFAEALNRDNPLEWRPPVQDFILDLPASWEEFRSGLKRNIRESLRHCYNSLKRDGHRFEFLVIEEPEDVRRHLDRFLELHRLRANMDPAVPHPDRFASRVCRNFLYEVCERLAARGALRLFALQIGSSIVAMRLGFVAGDSLYFYYSGFDPQWARYSVMTTTVAEAIKYAMAHGLKTVNLSPTREVSKTRWGPRQVDYGSAFEFGGRLRSRLARRAYLAVWSDSGYQSRLLRSRLLRRFIAARGIWN